MAAKSHVVIFALVLSILATAAFEVKIPKSYEPINPKDPTVVEIAKFTVAEYNKKFNKALVLLFVEKGEGKSSPTDGTMYELYIYTTSTVAGKEKYVTFGEGKSSPTDGTMYELYIYITSFTFTPRAPSHFPGFLLTYE